MPLPGESSPFMDGDVVTLDGRSFSVRVSARRKRVGLTVGRDGSLILRVPDRCGRERAEAFVRRNRHWIEDKAQLRKQRQSLNPPLRLIDGEIVRYLARDYRMRLVDDDDGAPVRLVAGELRLHRATTADPQGSRKAITAWYCRAGERWATGRTQPWAGRMDVPEPALEVRDVGRRWGTYRRPKSADSGWISLHWAVFQLPVPLIDYVIAHELAHIKVSGHGPDYWRLLRRAIPECQELKEELDEMGRRVWLGDIA